MRKLFSVLCIAVLCFGVIVYAAVSRQKTSSEPARAFTVVYLVYTKDANGVTTYKGIRIRDVQPDGMWREVSYPFGKSGSTENFASPDGVFLKNSAGQQRWLSPNSPPEMLQKARTIEYFETNSTFVGTDMLAGLKIYRLRRAGEQKEGSTRWLEIAGSPQTGLTPLRIIDHRKDGEYIAEAVKVEFK